MPNNYESKIDAKLKSIAARKAMALQTCTTAKVLSGTIDGLITSEMDLGNTLLGRKIAQEINQVASKFVDAKHILDTFHAELNNPVARQCVATRREIFKPLLAAFDKDPFGVLKLHPKMQAFISKYIIENEAGKRSRNKYSYKNTIRAGILLRDYIKGNIFNCKSNPFILGLADIAKPIAGPQQMFALSETAFYAQPFYVELDNLNAAYLWWQQEARLEQQGHPVLGPISHTSQALYHCSSLNELVKITIRLELSLAQLLRDDFTTYVVKFPFKGLIFNLCDKDNARYDQTIGDIKGYILTVLLLYVAHKTHGSLLINDLYSELAALCRKYPKLFAKACIKFDKSCKAGMFAKYFTPTGACAELYNLIVRMTKGEILTDCAPILHTYFANLPNEDRAKLVHSELSTTKFSCQLTKEQIESRIRLLMLLAIANESFNTTLQICGVMATTDKSSAKYISSNIPASLQYLNGEWRLYIFREHRSYTECIRFEENLSEVARKILHDPALFPNKLEETGLAAAGVILRPNIQANALMFSRSLTPTEGLKNLDMKRTASTPAFGSPAI